MSYRISEEKISEVRNATNIVDVVSEVVQLRKAGKNFLGLCPFHSEKTPSFTVSPDKQIFYCFGCREGGNVFSFLMKHERLSFPEAVRTLAKRNGIDLPEPELSERERQQYSEREKLFKINKIVMNYYQGVLQHPKSGRQAMGYLTKRGLDTQTISAFNLGYAAQGWQNLFNYLYQKKVPAALIEKAGLIVPKKDKNGFYDRFRNRIIFPIFNIGEQVVGFGGRAVDDSMPKYLNSPETPLYNKRQLLYGLHKAKQTCRETGIAYIVEGYLDCITLHQYGLFNSVATLGTALTPEHIRVLRGFAEKVILVFDSDEAGIKAATRSISLFMDQGVDARIFVLPTGNDPDSYVHANGVKKFVDLSGNAFSIIEFLIDVAVKKHGLSIDGKVEVVNELLAPMASLNDPVARSLYVKAVSERVGIEESAVLLKLNDYQKNQKPASGYGYSNRLDSQRKIPDIGAKKNPNTQGGQMERQIIAMMLQFPEIMPDIKQNEIINYFKDPLLKSIGMIILEIDDASDHFISDVLNNIQNDTQKQVVAELSIQNDEWHLENCKKLINRFLVQIQAQEDKQLIDKIKEAEKCNDTALLVKLLGQKQKNAENMQKQKMILMGRLDIVSE